MCDHLISECDCIIIKDLPKNIDSKNKLCNSNIRQLCDNNECGHCYHNSFSSVHGTGQLIAWSNKNKLTARQTRKYSNIQAIFNCTVCNHEYTSSVNHQAYSKKCPYCTHKRICECQYCYKNSLESILVDSNYLWHELNDVAPNLVFKNSNTKYMFECVDCNHVINTPPSRINVGDRCPYCSGYKLCKDFSCMMCVKNSVVSIDKEFIWSKKNDINPRFVFRSSDKKYLLDCDKCGHDYSITPSNIIGGKSCPYCNGNKLCKNLDCVMCKKASFVSNEKAIYWSKKNELTPREVFSKTKHEFYFDCPDCGNEFVISLQSVSRGHFCNICIHKTEKIMFKFLSENYNTIHQYKVDWCKNINHLPFDFCLPELNTIVELDGRFHFVDIWTPVEESLKKDKYKELCANKNGFKTVRILQEDVYYNKYDWRAELIAAIKSDCRNTYLCKNNEYKNYLDYIHPEKYIDTRVKRLKAKKI